MSLSTERYISIFLDSSGEAQGIAWSLVNSCGLETWGTWPGGTWLTKAVKAPSSLPGRALGMLSCYIQEDSGPDMQKAWKKAAYRLVFFFSFFLFVTGLERPLPAHHQGLPSSRVLWSRREILHSWSVDLLGPCPEHTHPATALLVPLGKGHREPDLGSGMSA